MFVLRVTGSMSDRPASLLTATQRDRLDEEFDGLSPARRRRERQRIRRRVAAGIADLDRVVELPDDELRTALEEFDDDDALAAAAANCHLLGERLRIARGVDPEAIESAYADGTDGEAPEGLSLARRRLASGDSDRDGSAVGDSDRDGSAVGGDVTPDRTAVETEPESAGDGGGDDRTPSEGSAWRRRAELLTTVGVALVGAALAAGVVQSGATEGPVGGVLGLFGLAALVPGLALIVAGTIKRRLVPGVRRVIADPAEQTWERL